MSEKNKSKTNFNEFLDDLMKEWFMNKIHEIDEKCRLCKRCLKKIIDGYYE